LTFAHTYSELGFEPVQSRPKVTVQNQHRQFDGISTSVATEAFPEVLLDVKRQARSLLVMAVKAHCLVSAKNLDAQTGGHVLYR
jgi:hypothetical protein